MNENRHWNGRRVSWNGAVVENLTGRGEPGYWRVTHSTYDKDTGDWEIHPTAYLGTVQPPGPVYRWTGKTWDMSAKPLTVFPLIPFCILVPIGFFTAAYGIALISVQPGFLGAYPLAIFGGGLPWWIALHTWVYRIEPVRGTKISAAVAAFGVALSAASRAHDPGRQGPQQWDDNNPTGVTFGGKG